MRKKLQSILIVMFTTALIAGVSAPIVNAEEIDNSKVNATFPVEVTLEGTLPDKEEEFEIVLKADDTAYPMPVESTDGTYSVIITGEGKEFFPEITFSETGIYSYTVWQEAGVNEKCEYDDSIYTVTVYVTNAEAGGFETTVAVYKVNEEEKQEIKFHNIYENEVAKTGDTNRTGLYIALFSLSALLICILLFTNIKRNSLKREE